MKKLLSAVLIAIAFNAGAQNSTSGITGCRAAMAKELIRVVDQNNVPIQGARIWGGFQTGDGVDDYLPIEASSGLNGICIINGMCSGRLTLCVDKEGYYPTRFSKLYDETPCVPPVMDGMWQPYGEELQITLKEIIKPGCLSVFPSRLRRCRIPIYGQWLGFDFEKCDWVSPYGEGAFTDVCLRFSSSRKQYNDFKYQMDVSFTNCPHAGAYRMRCDKSSALVTVYDADTNAVFKQEFTYVSECVPGYPTRRDALDEDSYLVFRTRTKVDPEGRLTSAHYGKILGEWFSGNDYMFLSDGCFNMTENDTNLEDGTVLRDVIRNRNRR